MTNRTNMSEMSNSRYNEFFKQEVTIDIEVTPVVIYYKPAEPSGYRDPGCPAEVAFYLLDMLGRRVPVDYLNDRTLEDLERQLLEAIKNGQPVEFDVPCKLPVTKQENE